jgi:antirestriction protein ArdC
MARYPLTTQENNVKENVDEHQPGNSRSDLLHIIPSGGLITALKNDKRMIFTAAAHAQRAADFLHALQSSRTEAA